MKKNTTIFTMAIALLSIAYFGLQSCSETDYNQGKALYQRKCANCHIEDGSGLKGLIPPLAKSDYLIAHKNEIACMIKYGLQTPIIVNEVVYNQQVMPANEKISAADMTNIINYILSEWGNQGGVITLSEVNAQLEACRK
jgi:mono/diheme cytochrome c family protein